jgi:ribosomal protein S18 acetylase RimI-like enzyme
VSVTYRRGVPDDASRLAAFAAKTFTHTYAAFNTAEDMRAYIASSYGVTQQTRELTDPGMITVLAEGAGALVGYAQLRRSTPPECVGPTTSIEIYRFYVDAGAHGTGVAQRLMEAALDAARDLGGRQVWLGVWERNERARAFYRKSGFRDVGQQFFQLGADRQTDRVLVKVLGMEARCPECGAALESGRTCRDYFDELLTLEWQIPGGPGEKSHFLAVASYNLQHPSLFTPAMLVLLRQTLADVIAGRATIEVARARARTTAEGSVRVRRRAGDSSSPPSQWPRNWVMNVRDVCGVPASRYLQQVDAWATSVDSSLP